MDNKIVETYDYYGLGFKITLYNIEMVWSHGEYYPLIDVLSVAAKAFEYLTSGKVERTKEQEEFVRKYAMPSKIQLKVCEITTKGWNKIEIIDIE